MADETATPAGPAAGASLGAGGAAASAGPGLGERRLAIWIAGEAARAAGLPQASVPPEAPLTGLGLDSLAAVELQQRIAGRLGVEIPLDDLLAGSSAAELAREVAARRAASRAEGEAEPAAAAEPAPPAAESAGELPTSDLPLSHGQRALWFLARLAPGSGAYHIAAAARARRPVDAAALGRALAALAARHPAFRATFDDLDGEPRQRIAPALLPDYSVIDAAGAAAAEVEALLAAQAYRPFDLARGPLLRAALLRGAEGGDRLLLAVHHLVADLASMGILVRDLARLYAAERGGPAAPPAPPAAAYGRWIAAEAARLAGPEGERLWRFWRERLAGAPAALDLPADRPRPPLPSYAGGAVRRRLAAGAAPLAALARSRGATLFMALLAGYQALLHRVTGEEDLLVGAPAAERGREELRGLVGYLVNPLVLRGRPRGSMPFSDLLDAARRAALDAFAHQGFPFPLLAERLRPERDPSRSPVFQTTLVLQRAAGWEEGSSADGLGEIGAIAVGEPGVPLALGGLDLESVALPERFAPFDLSLRTAELAGGLVASFQYSADLFDRPTIERLLGHLDRLLAAAVADPERRIDDLPLLGEAERWQLAGEWSDTADPHPALFSLYDLVAAQVARIPDAVAASAGGEHLSYGELDRHAARLARRLADLGVGPESRVGLRAERSLALVVGLAAILRAGAAYVPLDPDHPPERLAFVAADALGEGGVSLVQPGLPPLPAARLREVPLDDSAPSDPGGALPARRIPPGALAYVLYTSGSTGRPKGAMNAQGGLANRLLWMQESFPIGPGDAVAQKTPISFDVSVWELLWPLLAGARLALVRPGGHRDPAYLARWLAEEEATVAHFVPSLLAAFLAEETLPELRALRRLFASGEALSHELEQLALARLGAPLANLYGPTEAAIDVTAWRCREAAAPRSVAIGRPVANTQIYVVDHAGALAPIGVPGELWIGGVQVARGYQRRPDLTAERFVPPPGSPRPGARPNRRGDLARRWPAGEVEYLGRLDLQVKVRGVRIEMGEVEAALAGQPEVREAAVVALGEGLGARLAAFVVPRPGALVDAAALRARLRERLPEAMVPGSVTALPALPLTPSGKLDRRALARLAPAPAADAWEPPRTPIEEILAGLWSDLLGEAAGPIGRGADFFALGGHSLLATRLAARIERTLGLGLPLAELFAAPTLAGMAARLAALASPAVPPPPIRPVPSGGPLLLSFAQERLWLVDRLAPGGARYNLPAALRLRGPLDRRALAAALAEIARRHEALRTSFPAGPEGPFQAIAPPAPVPLPLADLAGLPAAEGELARVIRDEARRPFDLRRGPVLRAALLRLGDLDHVLLVTLHHVAADGWSVGVLERELSVLYAAFAAGRPSPLPELDVQYADYAVWQRRRFAGELLAREVAWWRERLADAPAELALPLDRPRPAVPGERGGTVPLAFPEHLAARLAERVRREGATPFMVLLAALQSLLGRYSGERRVPVGTPIANRLRVEVEGLVGFFVNTLVLAGDLAGDPSFRQLLSRARAEALAAYAHQELPFERLVEALAPERRLGRMPLFQVLLALQDAPSPGLALPGLAAERLPVAAGTAKLDLAVLVTSTPGGLAGEVEYDAELFDRATALRLAGHLARLLAAALDEPGLRLSELPLLAEPELAQLAREWRGDEPAALPWTPVHALVLEQARRRPEAPAIGPAEGAWITYGELAARALGLAARLRDLGVGPEVAVAQLAGRTPHLAAGALAVLTAGGALVPLDPASPRERLAAVLADARPAAVLAERGLTDRLPADSGLPVVLLDEGAAPGGRLEPCAAAPGQLACVVYTSGSLGRPKGVEIPHGALGSLADWYRRAFALAPGDRASFLFGVAFDAAMLDLWPALSAGASLHLPDEATRTAPAALRDWLVERRITRAGATTVLAEALLRLDWPGDTALRSLVAGGERLASHPPPGLPFALVNGYGPTECTVVVSAAPVPPRDPAEPPIAPPSIGRPIDGVAVHLLDRALRPVPLGAAGEIAVSGPGLARGYRGRPDWTAASFVPDPFGSPGGRLYLTGDLGRFRATGELDFAGRLDGQVKVRGHRIEPGEVEAVLKRHPAVVEALVTALGSGAGRRLAAVAVVRGAPAPGLAAELRAHLRAALPEAMVPAAIAIATELPLTANGKLDRRALARLAERATTETPEGELPRTPVEEVLAALWGDLLDVEAAGIFRDADFFALGGHSLAATRLAARVERALGVALPPAEVFAHPTLAALAARIRALRGAEEKVPPLVRVERAAPPPASFAQERLWFIDRLEPGGALYNVAAALRLTGDLDVPALARALAGVARRHEVLRTTFAAVDGRPVQVVHPPAPVPLPVVDLAGIAAGRAPDLAAAELARLAAEEAERPFDLARGPLLRATVVRLGAGESALLLTLHHIVSDGWSVGVLAREMAALYRPAGATGDLPPLPLQYADFAVWQRRWLSGETFDRELAWWRERLAGMPPELPLPSDRPRPAAPRHRGLRAARPIAAGSALATLARREGATLFMVLSALFELLLARFCGEEDVAFGTPVANRGRAGTEGLVGLFVNTLVLRGDLSGAPSFEGLLARARAGALAAYAHQDLPFEKLVEALAPERSAGRAPLVQAMLALPDPPLAGVALPGLALSLLPTAPPPAKLDLSLEVTREPGSGELLAALELDRDLFDPATAERLLAALAALAAAAAADQSRPALALPLLGEAARQEALAAGEGPLASRPALCLHEFFAVQARRAPDRVALRLGGAALSFAELDRRAERWAERLMRLGVGPDVPVGLAAERSFAMVVGILAVWKAGGAYVPLDPEHPPERLAALLAELRPRAVLVQGGAAARLPAGTPVLRLEDLPAEGAAPPRGGASPASLAYVLYTSGSTGRPKGVMIPHGALANHALAVGERYRLAAGDVVLQASSFSFDASVWELTSSLLQGGGLAMPRHGGQRDPAHLVRTIAEEGVTVVQLVPALAAALLDEPGIGECASVRLVVCGGEPLPGALARRILRRLPGAELVNAYGPTECTIDAALGACRPGEWRATAPIGRPLANVRAHALDATQEPLPAGAPGELHVGGAGLARGYLGRPDLTAERFVPDPWSAAPGERLYRTGDRVRRLPSGEIEHLGRLDEQVKVRGYRIELGEIEAVLAALPEVREAAVAAAGEGPARRLVAWVAPAGPALDKAALRRRCRDRLPSYMVPAAWGVVERLPHLPSGKLDRRALAALEAPPPEAEGGRVAPRTPLEEILAAIAAEVLGAAEVGVESDFFAELGGHSLLATQVVARVRERLGIELPLRALFEAPTVAGWAAAAEGATGADLPPIRRRARAGEAVLSFAQERLWFLDQLAPGLAVYNMPLALRLAGPLDRAALGRALSGVVARHEALRTAVRSISGRPVPAVAGAAPVPLPLADLGALPEERRAAEAARLASEEAARPFDLGRAPLLRARLLRLGEAAHEFLLTLHHIACDGWSLGVLAGELSALYAGEALPEPPVQYADYAAWQRELLAGEELARQVGYWRGELAGVPPLELPADRPRPPAPSHRGGAVEVEIPAEVAGALRRRSREAGATLFMTLLAGFELLLARWSGQDDLAVGTVVANRRRRELEGLIGFFVNTLALRARLAGNPTFRELQARAREAALGAYAHQDLPFEKLVGELQPERDASRAPLVQAVLMLQNTPEPELRFAGIAASAGGVANRTARWDVALALEEHAGGGLGGVMEYAADLFDAVTAERMAGCLRRLLAAAAESPERDALELPMLDEEERRQALLAGSRMAAGGGGELAVHEMVAAQVARRPDAVAVTTAGGERAVSYGEVERRAGRLARRLRDLGVGPEAFAGVCLERGPDLVVALLGVLRAGGAYVPLDPSHPAERLAVVIEDARPRVVVTTRGLEKLVEPAAVLCIEDVDLAATAVPVAPALAESPAYAIFTSGSTGRPKGVVVAHGSLSNFLVSMRDLGLLDAGRALLSVTTVGFDIAGLEIFLPLVTGGTVAMATREEALDGERLREVVGDPRVQALQATPATWQLLLEAGWVGKEDFRALCGGEALAHDLAERLLHRASSLWNLYGPTETTIWSSALQVEEKHLVAAVVPLGLPIARTRLHVLDGAMAPTPVGVPGELYIGGAGLARGYLGRPELTAERFVPDPFGAELGTAGERLYRTGDRVRRRADGELEYLGRLDQQVKLRGFRIEPGEIEAALMSGFGVRESVVVLREMDSGDRRLVAYVVPPHGGAAPEPAELARRCRERLPAYMVPSAFVVLAELPRLPNGKLDRRALPAPALSRTASAEEGPLSPLAELLGGVWAEVLGVEQVGAEEDFFADLGGHSLLAAQVVARARERLGIELPLRSLFEAPTLIRWAALAETAISSKTDALYHTDHERVPPPWESRPAPLSFEQERLWFLDRMTPGLAAYHLPLTVRLAGRLDVIALRRALAGVVARHEVLRTGFELVAGRPVQIVAPASGLSLPLADLSRLADPSREAARLAREEAAVPFDLRRGPLLRARLLRLDMDEHRLLLTVHHVAADGWSLGVLVRELGALYAGERLPAPPLQYSDYAAWQRERLAGETLARQMAYWRHQLDGTPPLDLPADRPRTAAPTHRGTQVWAPLSPRDAADLRRLCRGSGVTLFMALLAGFEMLLARHAGQDDFAVGTVVANRARRELEGSIGFFANTLALRASVAGDPAFAALLARVRETALGAYAYQELPFGKLVEELRPDREAGRTPLVQAMLVLQNAPLPALDLGALRVEPLAEESPYAAFDLTLAAREEGDGGIACRWELAADLFAPSTVRRLADHLRRLLAAAAADPSRRLSELPMLGEAERAQVLYEWSAAAPEPTAAPTLDALFARQAARSPASPALVHGAERLTYGELAARAASLARRLRRRGVGPEVRVGLGVERSAGMIAALLGILAARGAYVPLDPEHPAERLALIAADAGLALVVASRSTAERLAATGAPLLLVDEEDEAGASGDLPPAGRADLGGTLAYVLYTSGSTGAPKGVAITHANATAFLAACSRVYPRELFAGTLASTALGFDFSVFEIFATFAAGGTVVLAESLFDDEALAAAPLTMLCTVPSLLQALLARRALPTGLRAVNLGGEALPRALADELLVGQRVPALWNLYGPTEIATCCALSEVVPGAGAPPIGRPLADARTYVLDGALAPVPAGAPGELYVGGEGVARGYLGRPARTAERFLPDPFAAAFGAPGARMYRTGDHARWNAAGELLYLGRADAQVKLRGLRIEPGEIEAALTGAPGVAEAAVLLREDAPGEPRLVAYAAPADLDPAALRAGSRERLPAYMVPSAFVLLDRLPRLPSGKVDRRALPAPDDGGAAAARFVPPRGLLEETLAGIWAEVLGVERVGSEDDFFADLGGHSLLATRAVAAVRERLGIDLPLRSLFEAPTVSAWAEVARRAGGPLAAPAAAAIPRRARAGAGRPERLPLSFSQERLWFLDQLAPGLAAYHMPLAVRLAGPLDRPALARALAALVARHESLRTGFPSESGRPVQEIEGEVPMPLPLVDLGALPAAVRAAAAAEIAAREARRPFDLRRPPLLRARLLRLSAEEHLFLLMLHHIVADGWSLGVLAADLSAFYSGEPLPELPLQYTDYALWQREHLQGEALARQMAYWRRQLAGLPVLELPSDRPRPAAQGYRGGALEAPLAPDLARGLRRLGREAGATLYMTLLAAFLALLARYGGEEDVAAGSAVANRRHRELEGLIGFFVNTLVLRASLAGAPTFRELLARVREAALGAYAHQDLPFETLVSELRPARDASHAPLVQVTFTLQNMPAPELRLRGLAARTEAVETWTSKLDLAVSLAERDGGIAAAWEHDADLFDGATIARMAGCFRRLLAAAVASPEAPALELPLLDEVERREAIFAGSRTAAGRGGLPGVHEMVAAQAIQMPDAVAVTTAGGEQAVSYGELDRRAGRLARRLRDLGLGAETFAGVCLERRPDLVVALLAVLRAGGAYVPLDPSHPAERLALVIEDARPRVVLATRELQQLGAPAPVLCLEDVDLAATESLPVAPVLAASPAYAIFTSGSTGRPKGVVVTHGSLANFLDSMRGLGLLDPGRALLSVTTVGFDIAGLEIFLPLVTGGTVAMATREEALDGERLRVLAGDRRVQALQATPATWQLLLEAGWVGREDFRALCGGEALTHDLAERLLHRASSLWNLYGPTETTIWSSALPVEEKHLAGAVVPLGSPIERTRLHVLDGAMESTPLGVPGELYIGGAGLARGYLGRPELTAERFVPDPFGAELGTAGERLYRTGDRVRQRADGELGYLGRLDQQVKLRGFRIEPGEIEAALGSGFGVREAVVVLREMASGDRRLVAYVAPPHGGAAPEPAELARRCRERLPAYMVPSAFVVLSELPRLPNGKLDRRALPASSLARQAPAGDAPLSPLAELLGEIWAEVLGVERVGAEEDFFADLGGHSLLAAQVVARARERLGVELPLRSLFEAPTLARWAALANIREADHTGDVRVPPPWEGAGWDRGEARRGAAEIRRGAIRPGAARPAPLSFEQERLWFLDRMTPGLAAYHLPMAVHLAGPLDVAALHRALAGVVARHEVLRTGFELVAGRPVQIVAPACGIALPLADLSDLADPSREAARLAREEAALPFDLRRGPLLRARLLRLGADAHHLLLTVHHVAADGWSLGVLVRELGALYAGEPLSAPPLQYSDYAAWQRERLAGETLGRQMAYWRGQLAGVPPLDLPADRPRPAVQSYRGGQVGSSLSGEDHAGLRRLCRESGVTLFMALLAGFEALLARSAGQEDFAVGTVVANRGRSELAGSIGFFANTLALRAGVAGDPTFAALLARARETALGAYAHQELPFGKLVEELHPDRDTSRTPLVQAMLVLQNAPQPTVAAGGLVLAPLPAAGGTAMFDLTLAARETEGGLDLRWEHGADLFDRATIARLAGRFGCLLAAAAAGPGRRIAELPLLGEAERLQVLVEWSAVASESPEAQSLPALFAAAAARTPAALAVADSRERLSYGELARRAARLAGRLRELGVGPEARVGVCMERSAAMVAALLAVLAAGGAYVPLDPDYPADRLAFMLADAAVAVVLASRRTAGRLPPSGARLLLADEPDGGEEGEVSFAAAIDPAAGGEALAYVIYTSGSTGTPKGVAIAHSNTLAFLAACAARYPAGLFAGTLAVTSTAFDVSIFEIFATLAQGGAILLAESLFDEEALAGRPGGPPATMLSTVPSLLEKLLATRRLPAGLKTVNLAGEPVPRALLRALSEDYEIADVRNMYGPTEATTFCTLASLAPGPGAPPIGRPVANARIYVLDGELEPAPAGVPGELYVGGEGVARGYLGRPALTAERFLPDPFGALWGAPGARAYRTGDRARFRADGELEYLGRLDQQVKLRGFRIEPGEVEAALAASPEVAEAAAAVREDAPGDRRLVAYVAPAPGGAIDAAALRRRCQERLPAYMVPSTIVVLDALPHLPNGKLDRRALPAPGAARRELAERFVAPRSALERTVAAEWREVLSIERVGIRDNFFDLGGHSLLAVTLQERLAARLEREVAIVDIFRHPTVESFAVFLTETTEARAEGAAAAPPRSRGVPAEALKDRAAQRGAALAARQPFRRAADGSGRPRRSTT